MSVTADLMAGIAEHLATAGVGVYRETGAYTASQVGIVLDAVPASPDRIVALTPYAADDDPTLSDSDLSLQIRVRGTRDPRTAYDLDDAAYDAMQNLPRTILRGVTVVGAWRTSGTYMGADENQRHERVSNYAVRYHRPSPNRT